MDEYKVTAAINWVKKNNFFIAFTSISNQFVLI
jgi:hypothetical protein